MNKIKKIGIVGSSMGENSFGVQKTYLEMISKFGDPVIIMPNDNVVECDLLILPGGADVNPSSYGQTPGFFTSNSDVFKQNFYDIKLKMYIESKIPILGICLGLQMINTFFGGTLIQNMLTHPSSPDRWKKAHDVIPCDENGRVIKGKKFPTNGHHHQKVTLDTISKELIPLYLADEDDKTETTIECLRHKTLPIVGIQWHFEEWYDDFTINIIKQLLNNKETVLA